MVRIGCHLPQIATALTSTSSWNAKHTHETLHYNENKHVNIRRHTKRALVIEERKSPTLHQHRHATQMFEDAQKFMMRSKQHDLSHLTQASGKWNVCRKLMKIPSTQPARTRKLKAWMKLTAQETKSLQCISVWKQTHTTTRLRECPPKSLPPKSSMHSLLQ